MSSSASLTNELAINSDLVAGILTGFIANEVRKVGFERVVVNLSGGVDSSLAALLAARALGPANVRALILPYRSSASESRRDAEALAKQVGLTPLVIDITPQIDVYFERFPDADRARRGNKMARERMSIAYDQSLAWSALVLGTSNKTELLLGYGTIFGDLASALNPLGDLYKTQVWQLARDLGIPESIVRKPPSADLWEGQTDEADLGFQYAQVDRLLYYLVDRRYSIAELEAAGFDRAFIRVVVDKVQRSQFKRRLPLIAKLSTRTIDREFRYPRDWGT
jgi:NAD+ synthase